MPIVWNERETNELSKRAALRLWTLIWIQAQVQSGGSVWLTNPGYQILAAGPAHDPLTNWRCVWSSGQRERHFNLQVEAAKVKSGFAHQMSNTSRYIVQHFKRIPSFGQKENMRRIATRKESSST